MSTPENRQIHFGKHPHDTEHPAGMKRVRVDGGDSKTPVEERVYIEVKAGYGEGVRVANARKNYLAKRDATT